jgi:hypothetical protein
LLLLPLVQSTSRTPITTAWGAITKEFSDDFKLRTVCARAHPYHAAGEPDACSRPSCYAPRAGQGCARAAAKLRTGVKYLRCTTSGAAGNGLGTTIMHLRAAAGIGLGNTAKYLGGAAGIGLGTTIKYLRRTTSAAASKFLGTTIEYLVNQNKKKLGTASDETLVVVWLLY